MGLKRDLKMSHSEFCSGGPGSRHSFKDTESLLGLADTLYTILILVVSADSRITGLWQIQFFPVFKCFSFVDLFNHTFICFLVDKYFMNLFDRINFFDKLCNVPKLFTLLLRNEGWFSFQIRLVSQFPTESQPHCSLHYP